MSGGKSASSSSSTSPYAAMLAKFGVQDLKGAEPVTQQLLGQEGEALRTGGVTNRIPIINRSVDAARQAASSSNQNTQQILSQFGLAGTAFGARIMAEENQKGNQAVANVPVEDTMSILGQAPAVSANATGAGAGLLGTAGGLTRRTQSSDTQSQFGLDSTDLLYAAAAL